METLKQALMRQYDLDEDEADFAIVEAKKLEACSSGRRPGRGYEGGTRA